MAKVGRPKNIESPEVMWQLFTEYVETIKANPIIKNDFTGKDADEVFKKLERPLTMEGFDNYCFDIGVISGTDHYFANLDGRYKEFVSICSRIRRRIRQDQIEGGMSGIYNPSITQRLNNLVERVQEDGTKEVTIKVKYESKRIGGNAEPAALESAESD